MSEEQINRLPEDKQKSALAVGKEGVWLEIACPDRACLDEEGRITLPLPTGEPTQKGFFLNLFCPEGSCEIDESTDVPRCSLKDGRRSALIPSGIVTYIIDAWQANTRLISGCARKS